MELKDYVPDFMPKCLELLSVYDLEQQSLKMSLGLDIEVGLELCCVTFPESGMTQNGQCYPLASLVPHTHESGCSLWPTPTATDYKGASDGAKKAKSSRAGYLRYATHPKDKGGSSYPHPVFVEALMGFPEKWTELED